MRLLVDRRVHVRRVDQRHARVERGVDRPLGLALRDRLGDRQVDSAEPDRAHLDVTDPSLLHVLHFLHFLPAADAQSDGSGWSSSPAPRTGGLSTRRRAVRSRWSCGAARGRPRRGEGAGERGRDHRRALRLDSAPLRCSVGSRMSSLSPPRRRAGFALAAVTCVVLGALPGPERTSQRRPGRAGRAVALRPRTQGLPRHRPQHDVEGLVHSRRRRVERRLLPDDRHHQRRDPAVPRHRRIHVHGPPDEGHDLDGARRSMAAACRAGSRPRRASGAYQIVTDYVTDPAATRSS